MKRFLKYWPFLPGSALLVYLTMPIWGEIAMFLALIFVFAPVIVDVAFIPGFAESGTLKEVQKYVTIRLCMFVVQVPVLLAFINFPEELERAALLLLVASALLVIGLNEYRKNGAKQRDE